MTRLAESEFLLDGVLRLRRAERVSEVAAGIAPVRRELEQRLGAALSRSRAAHLLRVSQTALDRWIAAGAVPTVLTPGGRVEIPRQFVVEMAEAIAELRRQGQDRHLLSRALEQRRRTADALLSFLPPAGDRAAVPARGHDTAAARDLTYHRVVAARLSEGMAEDARRRLAQLEENGHIHPRYAHRWRRVLARPLPAIAAVLTQDDQDARDLRQNSPFAGALNEHERRRIIDAVH